MDGRTENRWNDCGRILVVALLALAVRGWVITHTEVAARDSIGYIRYALQFDEKPWAEVVRGAEQHPAFPVALWVVSKPVRALTGGVSCDAMVRSAQIANLFAAVVMVIPVYFTGKKLFNAHAGLLSAALLQCLPVFVHVTADGLSEAVYLLFLASGVYFAVSGFRAPAAWRFGLAGLFAGLSYLTRPEGLELMLAVAVVLVAVGLTTWGWRPTLPRLAALVVGVAPCVGLYVAVTGHLTNKPTPRIVIGEQLDQPLEPPINARVNCATPFAAFWSPSLHTAPSRIAWAGQTLAWETAKAYHYGGIALLALGLVWFRRRLRDDAGMWVILMFAILHAAILWRMAIVIGYLSERHTLVFVLLGSFWAGAVIPELGRWVGTLKGLAAHGGPRWVPELLSAAVLLSGVPELLKPLHGNRAGHHAAGRWMAQHISADDEVIDPFCWAHFYAGCMFHEGRISPAPHARYVVLEQTASKHERLTLLPMAHELAAKGEPVYHWPERQPEAKALVVVYRVPPGK